MKFRTKLLFVMRLSTLCMLCFCLHLSAKVSSQSVTYKVANGKLEQALSELKKQTGYLFIYNDKDITLAKPVNIELKNIPVTEALEKLFKDQPLTYVVKGRSVVIEKKEEKKAISILNPGINSGDIAPLPPVDVRGKVVNEKGEPLAGVSVLVKGTKRGTSTDENGVFELKGLSEDAVLQFKGVNIEEYETPLKGRRELNFTAQAKVSQLEDVILSKGYYSTSQKLNTGNVVKVTGSQITNQPISNPILGLEGLVPGLLITQSNGLPGSRFTALIRGKNSIQNGSSPLFIIDGVPFLSDNDALTQLNAMLANSPFNSIDPNNIESIEILKDADATAIYGSRGAGGVILITTKKNAAGRNSLSVNISRGWGKVARSMQLMNTQQYLEMRKEAFTNDGMTPSNLDAPDIVSWDQNRYTDWKKEFIGGTAATYNTQLRYSGGNELTRFSVGTGYYSETTVFPGYWGNRKTTADISISHKTYNNKLLLNFVTSYSSDNSMLPAQDLTTYINLPPNSYPLKDAAGNFVWREADYSVGNPLAILGQKNDVVTDRLTANGIIAYRPFNSLEFKANIGYNKVSADERITSPITGQDPAYAPTGSSVLGDNFIKTWIIEPQVSYKVNMNTKLRIEALAGSTWQKTESERKLLVGSGYTNDQLLGSIAAAPMITATNSKAQYHYAAIFGRVGIDWDSKYIVNITARRDGSSRFGTNRRFANFGAVGFAWVFSNESFISSALPFLSFGKIRGSYGTSGNDQIGNYQYLDTYRNTNYGYDGQPGLTPSRLFNADYSWEENRKVEVAAELGFFQDKLTLNLNYYNNKSDNQIIRYSLPTQTGFSNILLNFPGVVQNKGFEISLNASIIKNQKFQWNTTLNVSHNQNILLSFPGLASSSYASTYVIDKPLNAFRGLHYTGVDAQTGIYQFEDMNKDGAIDNSDYDYRGTTDPKYFGGLSNSFSYKGFQLNILFEFRKQLGYDAVYYSNTAPGLMVNQPDYVINRWRKAGDVATYQRYTQDFSNPALYPGTYNMGSSDGVLTDASYIRLKNIAISYELPERYLKKLKAASCKFYLHVQNLMTITKYKGHDPESQSISSLPPLKMITVGTQVNF